MKDFLIYFSSIVIAAILVHFGVCIMFPEITNKQYNECESAIKQYYKEGRTEETQITPHIVVAKGGNEIYAIYDDRDYSRLSADVIDGKLFFQKHSIIKDYPIVVSIIFFIVFFILYFLMSGIKREATYIKKIENEDLVSTLLQILVKLIVITSLFMVALKLFKINATVASAFIILILAYSGKITASIEEEKEALIQVRQNGIGAQIRRFFEIIFLTVVCVCFVASVGALIVSLFTGLLEMIKIFVFLVLVIIISIMLMIRDFFK